MMDQTNFDYLFQVTAALAERSATSPTAAIDGGATFGVHFAQAAESTRGDTWDKSGNSCRAGDRPSERPAFEVEAANADPTGTEPESADYGGCAEPAQPMGCTEPARSDTGNSAELKLESNGEDESRKTDEDTTQDVDGLESAPGNVLVAESAKPDSSTDIQIRQTEAAAAESNGTATELSETARKGSEESRPIGPGTEAMALAKELAANAGEG
jgi:hypothetical protein